MTASELKKSILQMAIEGKLTEQSKKDEPVEKLLKRIKEEKEKLIKEGKIKKENTISEIYKKDGSYYERITDGKNILKEVCIDEELPFDIPDTWTWVRLGNVSEILRGGSPRPISEYLTTSDDGINWIKISDAEKNGKYINSTKEKIIKEGIHRSRFVKSGDFLLTNSMSFGRPYILNIDGCIHDGWLVLSKYKMAYDIEFLFYLLSSNFAYYQFCSSVSGAVVKNLSTDKVANSIFPLPPIEEQKRIVEKINLLMPLINEYDSLEKNITKLNKDFPNSIKKSILQYAIEGKLTEQSEKDEPVEKLLKRIKKEREKLIKEGKIKKDKTTSEIYKKDSSYYERVFEGDNIVKDVCIDDELPFDIPDSWVWVRLGELCTIINGFTPLRSNNKFWYNPTIPWFTVEDIHNQGRRIYKTLQAINELALSNNSTRILPAKTVLLCCTASVGEYAITEIPLTTNQQFNGLVINEYWKKYCMPEFIFTIAPTFKSYLLQVAGKTTFNFISVKKLSELLIPLPPIEEQGRIADKINRVNEVINTIKL